MKKIIGTLICILMFILGACSTVIVNASEEQINPIRIMFQNENTSYEDVYWKTWLVVDRDTGVNYIIASTNRFDGGIAITPRLNKDGSLYISK